MMKSQIFLVLVLFAFSMTSCKQQVQAPIHVEETKAAESNEHHAAHWSYTGETDPAHWKEIEKDADCGGNHQSPINIIDIDVKPAEGNSLVFKYSPKTMLKEVTNNGHSIQFNIAEGNAINYQGKKYALKQFHFHEDSEHTINGIHYPIEIHLVHVSEDNKLAVIGIFGKEGKKNELFEFFDSFLPIKKDESKTVNHSLDLITLLPKQKSFYSYTGSLTTPPCSEDVNWIVFKEPIILSVDEVKKLQENMPHYNYRPTQPLNDRTVFLNK